MSFSIKVLIRPAPPGKQFTDEGCPAKITIGDFSERLTIPIDYWSIEDYRRQWAEALERLFGESVKSALITEMYDPNNPKFAMMCWILYKKGPIVYIQNQYIPYDTLPKPFQTHGVYTSINDREIITEDGTKISEWKCSLTDVKSFLNELTKNKHPTQDGATI